MSAPKSTKPITEEEFDSDEECQVDYSEFDYEYDDFLDVCADIDREFPGLLEGEKANMYACIKDYPKPDYDDRDNYAIEKPGIESRAYDLCRAVVDKPSANLVSYVTGVLRRKCERLYVSEYRPRQVQLRSR
jgi:hypothetical protein